VLICEGTSTTYEVHNSGNLRRIEMEAVTGHPRLEGQGAVHELLSCGKLFFHRFHLFNSFMALTCLFTDGLSVLYLVYGPPVSKLSISGRYANPRHRKRKKISSDFS